MSNVVELKTAKRPKLIIEETIDEGIMFPKKLKEANEMLEKYPIEAWFSSHQYSETEKEEGISTNDILKCTDVVE